MKVNLSRSTLIFYSILAPFIMYGSFYNLMGVIAGTSTMISFGAFALFGFILLPLLLFSTYRQNRCTIHKDYISIGKKDYAFSSYNVSIIDKQLPFAQRPIFSTFRKNYSDLTILEKSTGQVVFTQDLDLSARVIEKMKEALPPS